MAKVRDLTKGNIGKELILFAIPIMPVTFWENPQPHPLEPAVF